MKQIMDNEMIGRSLKRIAHEILEKNKGHEDVVIVGIKTRGEALASRLAYLIDEIENVKVPYLSIDFKHWRDDVDALKYPIEDVDFDFKDKVVILVDDVIYQGRTIRAAMDGILYYGRAAKIQVVALIDRGHRQLPIKADYVGKNVPTSEKEKIVVHLQEFDNEDLVVII